MTNTTATSLGERLKEAADDAAMGRGPSWYQTRIGPLLREAASALTDRDKIAEAHDAGILHQQDAIRQLSAARKGLEDAEATIERIAHPEYGLGFQKLRGLARAYQARRRQALSDLKEMGE